MAELEIYPAWAPAWQMLDVNDSVLSGKELEEWEKRNTYGVPIV